MVKLTPQGLPHGACDETAHRRGVRQWEASCMADYGQVLPLDWEERYQSFLRQPEVRAAIASGDSDSFCVQVLARTPHATVARVSSAMDCNILRHVGWGRAGQIVKAGPAAGVSQLARDASALGCRT